jgi:GH24 family phage-related lysozyme (muramidase)
MKRTILEKAAKVLDLDEGFEHEAYKDSKGYWTIGRGHLLGKDISDVKFSKAVLEFIFAEDIETHWQEAIKIFGKEFLDSIEDARQIAILSLVFTLGGDKFGRFTSTIPAIKARDWARASELILVTKWAVDVDPRRQPGKGRDDRIALMLRTGLFPREYGIPNG